MQSRTPGVATYSKLQIQYWIDAAEMRKFQVRNKCMNPLNFPPRLKCEGGLQQTVGSPAGIWSLLPVIREKVRRMVTTRGNNRWSFKITLTPTLSRSTERGRSMHLQFSWSCMRLHAWLGCVLRTSRFDWCQYACQNLCPGE
jgi:hypothetical protein